MSSSQFLRFCFKDILFARKIVGQNAATTTPKGVNAVTTKPSTSPPAKRRLCKNEYSDIGFCVNSLECEVTRGINIGVCSKSGPSSDR